MREPKAPASQDEEPVLEPDQVPEVHRQPGDPCQDAADPDVLDRRRRRVRVRSWRGCLCRGSGRVVPAARGGGHGRRERRGGPLASRRARAREARPTSRPPGGCESCPRSRARWGDLEAIDPRGPRRAAPGRLRARRARRAPAGEARCDHTRGPDHGVGGDPLRRIIGVLERDRPRVELDHGLFQAGWSPQDARASAAPWPRASAGTRPAPGRPLRRAGSRALLESIERNSPRRSRAISAIWPAISTPVGPAPTTTNVSHALRGARGRARARRPRTPAGSERGSPARPRAS